jgi:hypothetical protein
MEVILIIDEKNGLLVRYATGWKDISGFEVHSVKLVTNVV